LDAILVTQTLSETPLVRWHQAHGGRMVDFAGWLMPVQYGSIVDEHVATRSAVGMFDVSHMGRLSVSGPGSQAWLESLLTRRVADMEPGRVRYTLITSGPADSDRGVSILDDALVAREADAADGTPRMSLVVNASNRPRVVDWLRSRLPSGGVDLHDATRDTAMIAVQGPQGVELVASLAPGPDAARITGLKTYRAVPATVADRCAMVSRTGYTGEDGVELVVAAADAEPLWEAIHEAGGPLGLRACGLGARDTLRLEAGMPLYGHELLEESDPFAIGLGLAIDLDGRTFPGATAFAGQRERPPGRVRIGIVFDTKRSARQGDLVLHAGRELGRVTSGSYVPTIGNAVAMAMVDRAMSEPGTNLAVAVRDSLQAGRVVPLPFSRRKPVVRPLASG